MRCISSYCVHGHPIRTLERCVSLPPIHPVSCRHRRLCHAALRAERRGRAGRPQGAGVAMSKDAACGGACCSPPSPPSGLRGSVRRSRHAACGDGGAVGAEKALRPPHADPGQAQQPAHQDHLPDRQHLGHPELRRYPRGLRRHHGVTRAPGHAPAGREGGHGSISVGRMP